MIQNSDANWTYQPLSKWCKNKHGASKIKDTFETFHSFPLSGGIGGIDRNPYTEVGA
jgi:hypothetical protein